MKWKMYKRIADFKYGIFLERNDYMKYEIVGRCLVLHLEEELDHHYAAKIVEQTNLLVEKYPMKHILFDFSKINFMDSSGIGMLMGRYKKVSYTGGSVGVIGVSERVERIMRLSGLYKFIKKYEDAETAIEEMQKVKEKG